MELTAGQNGIAEGNDPWLDEGVPGMPPPAQLVAELQRLQAAAPGE